MTAIGNIEGETPPSATYRSLRAINHDAVLPERLQETLEQLIGAAGEGLLASSVEVGLGVLRELFEAEVEVIVGSEEGKHNPNRVAVRHGHEDRDVTLGGRRVGVSRRRVHGGGRRPRGRFGRVSISPIGTR